MGINPEDVMEESPGETEIVNLDESQLEQVTGGLNTRPVPQEGLNTNKIRNTNFSLGGNHKIGGNLIKGD
ncbi:MAG: hypothetical protein JWP00_4203 [Chloroflexi bacterium]|jgi:hypothetical protein|nr:hypothetical protein [Chloroflexota bacterium]